MAKSRKKSGGGRTRFSLSRKGEIALAAVGLLIVALMVFLVWSLLSPRILPVDEAKTQKERELSQKYEARWSSLLKNNTILRAVEERQDLYVDSEKWNALLPTEQAFAATAICAHFKWHRCFLYDVSGQQLAWYTEGGGYQRVKPEEKPK